MARVPRTSGQISGGIQVDVVVLALQLVLIGKVVMADLIWVA